MGNNAYSIMNIRRDTRNGWTILREVLGEEIGAEPTLGECWLTCWVPYSQEDRRKEFLCIVIMEAKKRDLKTPVMKVVICADEKAFKEAYRKYYNDTDDTTGIGGFCRQGKVYVRSSSPIVVLSHELWHSVQDANNLPSKESEADEVASIVQSQFLLRIFEETNAGEVRRALLIKESQRECAP